MLQTKNMIDTMELIPLTRYINFFISFNLVIRLMTSEYVTIGPRPWEAKIFLDHDHSEEIAEIKKGEDQKSFKLIRKNDGHKWTLTKKVHGEFRPFQSLY